jgi:hypothetical protein
VRRCGQSKVSEARLSFRWAALRAETGAGPVCFWLSAQAVQVIKEIEHI